MARDGIENRECLKDTIEIGKSSRRRRRDKVVWTNQHMNDLGKRRLLWLFNL